MSYIVRKRAVPTDRRRNRFWGRDAFPERLEARALLSTISGTSFHDLNSNGLLGPGEPGLAGRTVYIDSNRDGVLNDGEPSVQTDSAGNYQFTGLSAGGYVVRQAPFEGYNYTSPPTGSRLVFVPTNASNVTNQNFGSRLDTSGTGQVTGTIYEDLNESGFRDAGEPVLAGMTVFADLNSNGLLDQDEPSAVSNASGAYSLVVKVGSLYQIRQVLPSGWELSQPSEGFYFAPVFSESTVPGRHFGNIRGDGGGGTGSSTIGGTLFDDLDGDGVKDGDGEAGIEGRTVYIDANGNGLLDPEETSTQTDAAGGYTLSVDAGSYVVRTVVPPGFELTAPASGFHQVTIGEEEDLGGFDFGTRSLTGLSISGTVFRDIENVGARDPGEPGIADFVVYLDLNRNQSFDAGEPSVLSGADGGYTLIVSVDPGFYLLRQVPKAGFLVTSPPQGFHLLDIKPDTPIVGRDFGNFQLGGGGTASLGAMGGPAGASDRGRSTPIALLVDDASATGRSAGPISAASAVEGDDRDEDSPADVPVDRSPIAQGGSAVGLDPVAVDRLFDGAAGDSEPEGLGGGRLVPLLRD